MKKKNLFAVILFLIVIFNARAQEKPITYGKAGDFDLSTGFSGSQSVNSPEVKQWALRILPYANHFLWDNIFLRYDMGISVTHTSAYYILGNNYTLWSFNPGLAVGYSFSISERWRFNISAGYLGTFYQYFYNHSASNFGGIHTAGVFYPELKYLLTDRWNLSLMIQTITNWPTRVFGSSQSFIVTTQAFIVAGYSF